MSRGVLVTGASRGIGRAVAMAFAGEGDRVAVHYGRSREGAAAGIASLPGDGHVLVQGDLTDPDVVHDVVDRAAAGLGRREVLDGPGGDAVRNQSPFGRVAHPEEVAAAVLWLASEAARFSSGTIIDVK